MTLDTRNRRRFPETQGHLSETPVLGFPAFDEPFVVETDTLSVSIGTLLSQKKKARLHPVQFASRTMKASERRYSACKRVTLAVIFELNTIRDYLMYVHVCRLITDHQASQYEPTKLNVH